MARKALYKHATQVDTTAYPDDGSSPVGSNEWNADPDAQGMLGFTPANATRTISSGVLTVTDSITVAAAESGTSDVLDKLAITNTNQFDLIYLFADTGDTITLTNTSSPSADGQIKTVSGQDETLSTTSPTILIRKGNYWYGYGGGVVNAINDVGDVNITSIADNDLLAYDNSTSKWINQSPSEAGIITADSTTTLTNKTLDADATGNSVTNIEDANIKASAGIAQSKIANLSTDLSAKAPLASPAFTTAATLNAQAELRLADSDSSNYVGVKSPATVGSNLVWTLPAADGSNGQALTTNGSGTLSWASAGGAYDHGATTYSLQGSDPSNPATDKSVIYMKDVDSNNEGLFIKIKKNGSVQIVQIA